MKIHKMKRYLWVLVLFCLCTENQLIACSVFNVKTKDGVLIGRNFDYHIDGGHIQFIPASKRKNGIMIIQQRGRNWPYEGINDQGLFIGMAAVPNTSVKHYPLKSKSTSLGIIRKALRKFSTVEEVIEFFKSRSIIFGRFFGAPMIHYMIVDKKGNSAIIEFVDNELKVIRKKGKYQAMTNFYQSKVDKETTCERFQYIDRLLSDSRINDQEDVMKTLEKVSAEGITHTIWSSIYDLKSMTANIYFYKGFDNPYQINILDEIQKGRNRYRIDDLK